MILQRYLTVSLMTIILMVQVLLYPSFKFFHEKSFKEAMEFHQQRISWIVVPLMLCELFLSFWLVIFHPNVLNLTILAVVLLIWASTFFLQVPLHHRLLLKKDPEVVSSLVKSNLVRTFLWGIKLLMTFCGVTS